MIAGESNRTTHEPVAVPGGVIFVPAELFRAANDEAEFAGMLAHAMAHVAQRHGTRLGTGNSLASVPVVFVGGWVAGRDGVGLPLALSGQLRNNELEADALAVEVMARAGFDPAALLRYVERVRPASPTFPGTSPKVFSLLPERDQEVAAIRAAISRLPQSTYSQPGAPYMAVRDEVLRLAPWSQETRRGRNPPTLRRGQ